MRSPVWRCAESSRRHRWHRPVAVWCGGLHGRSLMPTDPTTGHETRGWLTDLERRVLRAVEQTAAEGGRDITVAEAVRRIRRLFHRVSTARDDGRCPTC